MNDLLFSQISLTELLESVSKLFDDKIKKALSEIGPISMDKEEYLSRKEAARLLKLSLPTLHTLTLTDVLKSYRVGRRILYKKAEVIHALKEVNVNKYKSKVLNPKAL